MTTPIENLLSQTGDIALKRRAKWIVEQLNPQIGDKILDVGCGDGFYLHLLSNLGLKLKLTGIDIDQKALQSAKINLKNKDIKLLKTSIAKLPFEDETFDGVIVSEVLEHLPNEALGLKEVKRVLKKKGTLIISVPHADYPFFWDPLNWSLEKFLNYHIKSGFWAGIWNQHLRLYQAKMLYSLLKGVGFDNIKINKLTHYCLPFNHYIINLGARILANKNFSSQAKNNLSKFSSKSDSKIRLNIYFLFFLIDRLNNKWNGEGSALSLVASAKKS